jgi:hypothetical protein
MRFFSPEIQTSFRSGRVFLEDVDKRAMAASGPVWAGWNIHSAAQTPYMAGFCDQPLSFSPNKVFDGFLRNRYKFSILNLPNVRGIPQAGRTRISRAEF